MIILSPYFSKIWRKDNLYIVFTAAVNARLLFSLSEQILLILNN